MSQQPGGARQYGEPPAAADGPRGRPGDRGRALPGGGRALATPRTRGEAVAYVVALAALYGGVIAVLVLDAAGPSCVGNDCSTFHPGIRPAATIAAIGFASLVALAVVLTRRASAAATSDADADSAPRRRRRSARGWPLAWNYLTAGLVLPDAIRVLLGRPRDPP